MSSPAFKPSQVVLTIPPLTGSFGSSEAEFAAALIVYVCTFKGDAWQPVAFADINVAAKASFNGANPTAREQWMRDAIANPFLRADAEELIRKGGAKRSQEAVEMLPAGLDAIATRWVPSVSKPAAEFWTASRDEEHLSHESIDEAVEHLLDETELGALSEIAWPLKVYGWSRRDVSDDYLENAGKWLAEHAEEMFDEEFGGDDGTHQVLDEDGQARLAKAVTATLKEARAAGEISSWQCVVTETREVSEAEARSWFPEVFTAADRLPPRDGKRSEETPA